MFNFQGSARDFFPYHTIVHTQFYQVLDSCFWLLPLFPDIHPESAAQPLIPTLHHLLHVRNSEVAKLEMNTSHKSETTSPDYGENFSLKSYIEQCEKNILAVMPKRHRSIVRVAEVLKIDQSNVYRKLRKYQIEAPQS